MEDKRSSYPIDLPWQELKSKFHVDESIFQNKAINEDEKKEKTEPGSGSGSSIDHRRSTDDGESKQMRIEKPEKEDEARPLPHQQVPQPDDFCTRGLEQL